ncbi:MAG: right-handed parallel beta-helix repeat-containing protein [Thermoplasmata archaeon]
MYTYGDRSNLNNPGGIQNHAGSTCTIDNCNIIDGDTHSITGSSDASLTVKGTNTIIGSEEDPGQSNTLQGHGVYINGMNVNPTIEDVTIQYQKKSGLFVEDTILDTSTTYQLEDYQSNQYDQRVTFDSETTSWYRTGTDGDEVLVAYLQEESNSIYWKRSIDNGATWSVPYHIVTPSEKVGRIDLAVDGNNMLLLWENEGLYETHLLYSDKGGRIWTEYDETIHGTNPSIYLKGSDTYMTYSYSIQGPWQEIWILTFLHWTEGGGVVEYEKELDIGGWPSIDLELDNNNIYLTALVNGNIFFWKGRDNGAEWPIDKLDIGDYTPTTFDTELSGHSSTVMPPNDWVDLSVRDQYISVVWPTVQTGDSDYDIIGVRSEDAGVNWDLTPVTYSSSDTDSIWPSTEIDSNYLLHVTWEDGDVILYSRRDISTGAFDVQRISMVPSYVDVHRPKVTLSNGNIYYSWEDNRDGNSEIYIKKALPLMTNNLKVKNNGIDGIRLDNSNPVIYNCEINNNPIGISIENYANPTVRINDIHSNQYGIEVNNAKGIIESNNIHQSYVGVYTEQASELCIRSSTGSPQYINDNDYGIWSADDSVIYVSENEIYQNLHAGVFMENSDGEIRKNDIYSSSDPTIQERYTRGVLCDQSSPLIQDNEIYGFNGRLSAPSLSKNQFANTATRLNNGEILIAGGKIYDEELDLTSTTSYCEIYNPDSGTLRKTEKMNHPRSNHEAVLLNDGRVLVIGGEFSLGSCEIYDPGTECWEITDSLSPEISGKNPQTVVLNSGEVFVAGGTNNPSAKCEIYDPATDTWSAETDMNVPRYDHKITSLHKYNIDWIILTGGFDGTGDVSNSCEIYDTYRGVWHTFNIHTPRANHAVTKYNETGFILSGGEDDVSEIGLCEMNFLTFNVISNGFDQYLPKLHVNNIDSLDMPRKNHNGVLLKDNTVLIAGGETQAEGALSGCELLTDLKNPRWMSIDSMSIPRVSPPLISHPSGNIITAEGVRTGDNTNSCEIYNYPSSSWNYDEDILNSGVSLYKSSPVILENTRIDTSSFGILSRLGAPDISSNELDSNKIGMYLVNDGVDPSQEFASGSLEFNNKDVYGQTFLANREKIDSVEIFLDKRVTDPDIVSSVEVCIFSSPTSTEPVVSSSKIFNNIITGWNRFKFEDPLLVSAGEEYFLTISTDSTKSGYNIFGRDIDEPDYKGGALWHSYNENPFIQYSDYDLSFRIIYNRAKLHGNIVSSSNSDGIFTIDSNPSLISENTLENNNGYGIHLVGGKPLNWQTLDTDNNFDNNKDRVIQQWEFGLLTQKDEEPFGSNELLKEYRSYVLLTDANTDVSFQGYTGYDSEDGYLEPIRATEYVIDSANQKLESNPYMIQIEKEYYRPDETIYYPTTHETITVDKNKELYHVFEEKIVESEISLSQPIINWVSIPVVSSLYASDIYNDDRFDCYYLQKYDALNSQWISYDGEDPAEDFKITPDMGIQIALDNAPTEPVTYSGLPVGHVSIKLYANYNYIGYPSYMKSISMDDFIQHAEHPEYIQSVERWDHSLQSWVEVNPSYHMVPGNAYRVKTNIPPGMDYMTINYFEPGGDTDLDGLSYGEEIYTYNTDPTEPDTDGDGLWDGWQDTNGNEWYDDGEIKGEKFYLSDPSTSDTDGDRLTDTDELFIYNSNPMDADINDNDVKDGHLEYDNSIVWITDNNPNSIFEALSLTREKFDGMNCKQYPILVWARRVNEDTGIERDTTEQIIHCINQLKTSPDEIRILEQTVNTVPSEISTETGIPEQRYISSQYVTSYWENNPDKQQDIVFCDMDGQGGTDNLMPYAATFAHRNYAVYMSSLTDIQDVTRIPDNIYYFGSDPTTESILSSIASTTTISTLESAVESLTPLGNQYINPNTLATDNAVTLVHRYDNNYMSPLNNYWNWEIKEYMQNWKIAPIYASLRQTMIGYAEHNTKWIDDDTVERNVVNEIDNSIDNVLDNSIIPNNIDEEDINYLIIYSHWEVTPYRYHPGFGSKKYSADSTKYADRGVDEIPDYSLGRIAAWDSGTLSILSTMGVYSDSDLMKESNRGVFSSDFWEYSPGNEILNGIEENFASIYGQGNYYVRGDPSGIEHGPNDNDHNAPLEEFLKEARCGEIIIADGHGDPGGIEATNPKLRADDIFDNGYYNQSLILFDGCRTGGYHDYYYINYARTLFQSSIEKGCVNVIGTVDDSYKPIKNFEDMSYCLSYHIRDNDVGTALTKSISFGNKEQFYMIGDPMVDYDAGKTGDNADLLITPSSITMPISFISTRTIRAEIRNIGGTDVSGAAVNIYNGNPTEGGVLIGSDTVSVNSYDSTVIEVDWDTYNEGEYYDIYVEVQQMPGETFHGNNIANAKVVTFEYNRDDINDNVFSIELSPTMPYSVEYLIEQMQGNCIQVEVDYGAGEGWEIISGDDPIWVTSSYWETDYYKYRITLDSSMTEQYLYFSIIGSSLPEE